MEKNLSGEKLLCELLSKRWGGMSSLINDFFGGEFLSF